MTRIQKQWWDITTGAPYGGFPVSADSMRKNGYTDVRPIIPVPEPVNLYAEWYAANPDLATRVREYAALLDGLELAHTATTDEIAAAINTQIEGDSARVTMILQMRTAFDNIVLNLEYLDVTKPQYTAWSEMPNLIANLPAGEA